MKPVPPITKTAIEPSQTIGSQFSTAWLHFRGRRCRREGLGWRSPRAARLGLRRREPFACRRVGSRIGLCFARDPTTQASGELVWRQPGQTAIRLNIPSRCNGARDKPARFETAAEALGAVQDGLQRPRAEKRDGLADVNGRGPAAARKSTGSGMRRFHRPDRKTNGVAVRTAQWECRPDRRGDSACRRTRSRCCYESVLRPCGACRPRLRGRRPRAGWVAATWHRLASVRHRLRSAARSIRCAEQKSEIAPCQHWASTGPALGQHGEARCRSLHDAKPPSAPYRTRRPRPWHRQSSAR